MWQSIHEYNIAFAKTFPLNLYLSSNIRFRFRKYRKCPRIFGYQSFFSFIVHPCPCSSVVDIPRPLSINLKQTYILIFIFFLCHFVNILLLGFPREFTEFLVNINYYYTHIAISTHETRDINTCSTRQPSVFRDIDAGGNFASKLLEPLYNHHLAPNHSPLNHTPHTLNHSLYLLSPTYSSTPVPIHPLYYLLYVLYLCYSLLFITDYVPAPYFFLSTYNFNCQTITMYPPCLFL